MAKPVSKLLPLEPAVENLKNSDDYEEKLDNDVEDKQEKHLEADLYELEEEQRRRAERTTPSRTCCHLCHFQLELVMKVVMMMMGIELAEWEHQVKCFRDGFKVAPVLGHQQS